MVLRRAFLQGLGAAVLSLFGVGKLKASVVSITDSPYPDFDKFQNTPWEDRMDIQGIITASRGNLGAGEGDWGVEKEIKHRKKFSTLGSTLSWRKDKPFVTNEDGSPLADYYRNDGEVIWPKKRATGGRNYREEIRAAIKECDGYIPRTFESLSTDDQLYLKTFQEGGFEVIQKLHESMGDEAWNKMIANRWKIS